MVLACLDNRLKMSSPIPAHEKGQSLVELAVSFVFLLLLAGGIVDIGMMAYTFISLRDTVQEGAIFGSYSPADDSGIRRRILDSASSPIDASKITDITITCSGSACLSSSLDSCQGMPITVQVQYIYNFVTPMMIGVMGEDWTLNAAVTETILQSGHDPTEECP